MTRSVKEWIGKTDDTPVPPRVRDRVFQAKGGKCHKCGRPINPHKPWTCEHVIAIINGGANREKNLDCTCEFCLPEKNAADVAEKSKTYAMRSKHLGIKPRQSRPLPGTRASGWRRRMNGTVERWT